MRKKSTLLFSFVFLIFKVFSQGTQMPQLIPQSPQAATFARYGEIPVDLSTGVPNINIPIYTIKLGEVEIPISISYHASGIKVSDVPSEVGLGWVLNVGGNITAQILGQPDFAGLQYPTYKKTADVQQLLSNAANSSNPGSAKYQVARTLWYDLTQRGPSEPGLNDGSCNLPIFRTACKYTITVLV